jgi:hypothetical protein
MSDSNEDAIRRETLKRAIAVVQTYRDENYRRLRVNDICDEIMKRLAQLGKHLPARNVSVSD